MVCLAHCPLLQHVAEELQARISATRLATPELIYVGNVNARAKRTKELVASDLANNIAHGVRWHGATTVLKGLGCHLFWRCRPDMFLAMWPGKISVTLIPFPPRGTRYPRFIVRQTCKPRGAHCSTLFRETMRQLACRHVRRSTVCG
jgi:hypothetical protein